MTGASPTGSGFRPSDGAASVPAVPASIPSAGDQFTIDYPFIRDTYQALGSEGFSDEQTWRPGVRFESVGPEDCGSVADALGSATFTVVAAYKPGRFPTRVFFTRRFRDPDGREFGKSKLHIVTLDKFRRLARGYQHPFGIGAPLTCIPRFNAAAARAEFEAMLSAYAQGTEARRAETGTGSVHDGPVATPCAQPSAGDA